MDRMKKAILVELETQQLALLDEQKKKTGAPRVETIRRAIALYLNEENKKAGRRK
jgi:metal-responsive CopG/Arc/MetJ family transcriptional regulator